MYDANIWWHFFQFFIFMCPVSYLTYKIFVNHLRVGKISYWILVLIYTLFTSSIIALTLTEISPFPQFSFWGINLIIISSIVVFKILVKKNTFSLLFVFFLYLNVQHNSLYLASATIDCHVIPQMISYENGDFLLISLLYLAIMFPLVYVILVKFYKRIVDEDIATKWVNFFFCLPAGYFFAILLLVTSNFSKVEVGKETLLPLILFNACEFVSYFAALESIMANQNALAEHKKSYETKIQLTLWEEQYEHLRMQVDAEARIRHDWRQHIILVMGFVEREDLDGLGEYLKEYKEKYLLTEALPICDNLTLNMLFQYYKRKAEEEGVILAVSSVQLKECHISDLELIIVFGNLLENAIEACNRMTEGERFVTMKIRNMQNSFIAIICENSFDGMIKKKEDKILSRKKDGGIGLSSVEDIVHKYNGIMKIQTDEKRFKVYVALGI